MIDINYEKILDEVSWRANTGVVDLTNESHLEILRKVLIEFGYDTKVVEGVTLNLKEQAKKKLEK